MDKTAEQCELGGLLTTLCLIDLDLNGPNGNIYPTVGSNLAITQLNYFELEEYHG